LGYFFNMSGSGPVADGKAISPPPASFIECYLLHAARINGSEYGVGVPVDVPVVLGYFEGNDLRPVDRLGGTVDVEELLVHIRSQLDLHDVGIYNTPVVMTLQGEDIGDDDEDEDEDDDYTKIQQQMSGEGGGARDRGRGGGVPGRAATREGEDEDENEDLSVDEVVRLERIDEFLDEPGSDEEDDEEDEEDDEEDEEGDEEEDGIGEGDDDDDDDYRDGSDEDETEEEDDDEELKLLERSSERPWSKPPPAHGLKGGEDVGRSVGGTDDDHAEDAWVAQRVRAGDFANLEEESKVFGFVRPGAAMAGGAVAQSDPKTGDKASPDDGGASESECDDIDDEASFLRDHRRADRIVKFARDVSMIGSYRHKGRTYHLLKLREPIYIVGKRNSGVGGAHHFTIMSETEASKVSAWSYCIKYIFILINVSGHQIATQIQRLLETRDSNAQRKRDR
jgi:hypothetical protein